jgi:hypothetical protein
VSDVTTRYLVEHVVSNVLGVHIAVDEGGRVRRDVLHLRPGDIRGFGAPLSAALRGHRDTASR